MKPCFASLLCLFGILACDSGMSPAPTGQQQETKVEATPEQKDEVAPPVQIDLPTPPPRLPKPGHPVVSNFDELKFHGSRPSLMVVVCSYNNAKFAERNLRSVLDQDYVNFRVYYFNDASTDKTQDIVKHFQMFHPKGHLITLINSPVNKGSHVENHYNMVREHAKPDDIVVVVDGDDQLSDLHVFTDVAKVYANYPVWLTYGQYAPSRGGPGHCTPIPEEVIANNAFRKFGFVQSHLRTFRGWLFLKIPESELKYQGRYTNFAGDQIEMLPMSELAGERIAFTDRILYNYEQENPISDFRLHPGPVEDVVQDLKRRTPLKRLSDDDALIRTNRTMKVGLLFHATGKYVSFAKHAIESARKFFLPHHDVKFFVFTDAVDHPMAKDPDVVFVKANREPWPWGTMRRNVNYLNHKALFDGYDYLFATDVDISVVAPIGDEILGELVGTRHPGFNDKLPEYCRDPRYSAYVDRDKEGEVYFMGGFFGGSRERFLDLVRVTSQYVHYDFTVKGLDPNPDAGETWFWHDESYLNRYFIDNPPTVVLPSSYGYHVDATYYYPKEVSPKILLLPKDNAALHQ